MTGRLWIVLCSTNATVLLSSCNEAPTETKGGGVPLGEPCRGFDDCAKVSGREVECICNGTRDRPICVAKSKVHEQCDTANCDSDGLCASVGTEPTGTCHERAALGETCGTGTCSREGVATPEFPCRLSCLDPYYCDGAGSLTPGTCVGVQANLGEACVHPWSCVAPYVCWDGVCGEPRALGEECPDWTNPNERSFCEPGTICGGTYPTVCVPIRPDGEPCYSNNECLSEVCFAGRCGRGVVAEADVPSCPVR